MSDLNSDKNTEAEDQEPSESGISGKGWDILVGGRNNPAAMGGSDPFDLEDAAGYVAPRQPPAGVAQPAGPPPRDVSPEELGYEPSVASVIEEESGEEGSPAMPGLSAGVTVTPLGPAIIEVPADTTSVPDAPPAAAAPTSPSIIEVSPSSGAPSPVSPQVGGPVAPPEGQLPEDVMTGPVAPPAMDTILSAPSVPPWPVPQGVAIHDPFASTEEQLQGSEDMEGEELPPDVALAKALITPERINALWDEINETYDLAVNDVRGHFNTTQQAIDHLKKARELLLSGPENFDNAERLVKEIKSRLRLEEKVRRWSGTRGAWLAAYLVMWFILLSLSSLATNQVSAVAARFVPDWMATTWLPGLFGGFGGVIGALWVLNKHITKNRDFDPIHTMWYVTNPILGVALGVVTYLLVRGGGWLVTQVGNSGDFVMTPALTVTLIVLCVIVGFNQNVLWALVDRFVKTVIPTQEEDEKAVTDEMVVPSIEKPAG